MDPTTRDISTLGAEDLAAQAEAWEAEAGEALGVTRVPTLEVQPSRAARHGPDPAASGVTEYLEPRLIYGAWLHDARDGSCETLPFPHIDVSGGGGVLRVTIRWDRTPSYVAASLGDEVPVYVRPSLRELFTGRRDFGERLRDAIRRAAIRILEAKAQARDIDQRIADALLDTPTRPDAGIRGRY